MAESAVSLVIENLIPLLIKEANLLKGVHEDVTSITREMEMIQSFLRDANIKAENIPWTLLYYLRIITFDIR